MDEQNEAENLLVDVLHQACGHDLMIDNQCVSAYEDACDYLEKQSRLEKFNDRSFKIL